MEIYKLIVGKIYWFVNPSGINAVIVKPKPSSDFSFSLHCLGFVREANGGAFVIGGPTGSHLTGHGEKWETKIKKLLDSGFQFLEEAKDDGKIAKLSLTQTEEDILKRIRSGLK